ncbi:MAG: hypothetical protein Q9166_004413 [cf. Caloplaca sp. 2 TL-2023]
MTNRGTAYILYSNTADAEAAIAHMHEAQLDGAIVNVSIVLPRRKFTRSPPPARRGAPPFDRFDGRGPPPGPYRGGPPPNGYGGPPPGRYRSPPRPRRASPPRRYGRRPGPRDRDLDTYRPRQDLGHTHHDREVLPHHEVVADTETGKLRHRHPAEEDGEGVQATRAIRATAIVVAVGIEAEADTEEVGRGTMGG